jgi:hypothetical protein
MFKCFVDVRGRGEYLPVEESPTVSVVAADPYRLKVVMPSDAVAGAPTWCLVRAEDRFGNPTPRFQGTVALTAREPDVSLPQPHAFGDRDRGAYRFEGVRFSRPGVHSLEARLRGGTQDRFRAASNPVQVARTRPERLLLWGDLHGHTIFSDGRGTVEEFYDVAQRVVGLDFCAVTDHGFELLDAMWEHTKAVTNQRNQPGAFVTFHGYEWSGATPDGGDHNVYFLEDDPPIYRSALALGGDRRNLWVYQGTERIKTVAELMGRLAGHLSDKNVFVIPHFGGRRGNPRWHDARVQRLIEVFSDHRRSEDWAATFLAAGHRVGIMASSDNHYGNPGYGYLTLLHDWDRQEIGTSAVAVYAEAHTREAIFHALYDRRCYATTGERIILDVRAGAHPMGSEVQARRAPEITVRAAGTATIARVEFCRDGQVVHRERPAARVVASAWRDPAFRPDRPSFYHVRVVQVNGELAVSSPLWIN